MRPSGPAFRFGALAGVLIATLGVLAEYAWSHVWMPLPWPAHLLPEAIALALPVAIAGGVLGTFAPAACGSRRARRRARARGRRPARACSRSRPSSAFLLPTTRADRRARADRAAHRARGRRAGDASRTVAATVRFDPPSAVADADWLTMTAWQGGDRLVVDRLRALGDGVYATTRPIPVGGYVEGDDPLPARSRPRRDPARAAGRRGDPGRRPCRRSRRPRAPSSSTSTCSSASADRTCRAGCGAPRGSSCSGSRRRCCSCWAGGSCGSRDGGRSDPRPRRGRRRRRRRRRLAAALKRRRRPAMTATLAHVTFLKPLL